jgi:hypothetical protein
MKKNGHRQGILQLVCFAARAVTWPCLALMSALVLSPPAAAQVCQWFGKPPFCAGECTSGYYDTGQRQGCFTGNQAYCCRIECGAKQGRNCKLEGPIGGQFCACDEFLKFHVRNICNVRVEISVEYIPAGNNATGDAAWHTVTHEIAPGATADFFQTNNRYVYVSGFTMDGLQSTWARQEVDLGKKLPADFTFDMVCQ